MGKDVDDVKQLSYTCFYGLFHSITGDQGEGYFSDSESQFWHNERMRTHTVAGMAFSSAIKRLFSGAQTTCVCHESGVFLVR